MSDFLAKVTAQLDLGDAESKMNSFLKQERKIKVNVDLDTGNINISNILNQIKSQFGSAGSVAGANLAKNINGSLNKIDLSATKKEIDSLKTSLKFNGFSDDSINHIVSELDNLNVVVQKVKTSFTDGKLNLNVEGVDQLGRAVTIMSDFDEQTGRFSNSAMKVTETFKQMFTSADTSKLSADISALEANFTKLQGSSNQYSDRLKQLKQELTDIKSVGDLSKQQEKFEQISAEVGKLSIKYKEAKAEIASAAAAQQLLSNKAVLGNQIETWMNKNTKAAKIYAQELKDLKTQLDSVENQGQLKSVSSAFKEIQTSAAASGVLGKSVFGQLASNFTKLSPLFGMGTAITKSISEVKSMISTVYQLDTALVDLQKTTTMNSSELNSFYGNANSIAKDMGVTTAEIINQAAAWSRLGYSSKEAAESMAKLSSQFAAISPGMDADKATEGLVSIMKAYDVEVDDVLDGVMSKINIIGNTAATSNSQIVEMLSRSSSAMAEANNSLEETIALETAAFEITQDASSVGTAYKTIAMRIRGRQSLPPYGENHMPRCA